MIFYFTYLEIIIFLTIIKFIYNLIALVCDILFHYA